MSHRHAVAVPDRGMLIDGQLVPASDGATMPSEDPTTESAITEVPVGSSDDVDRAVQAAQSASEEWSRISWEERAVTLNRYADVLGAHADELARLDALDAGLPIKSMRADVASAVSEARYFAGLASEVKGTTYPSGPDRVTFSEFVPYSAVARIVPFNHPIKFAAGKCSAALAAGAPVIIKPGEQTSLSALCMAELVKDIFPPGVYNVITGPGHTTGVKLVGHPAVPRVAFTGSVATGIRISESCAKNIKHLTLELGGKNPMIVMPDVDPRRAAAAAIQAMNFARSMGQSCGSFSRLFVHTEIYDRVVEYIVEGAAALKIGDPLDEATDMGPLAFREHHARVTGYVDEGKRSGAKLLYGGRRPAGHPRGFFLEPTIFGDANMSMPIARDEVFGPVLTIFRWSDYESMIGDVNCLELGLTGNIWTNDLSLALQAARRIEAGYITINGTGRRPSGSPFGGFKHSGLGKENSIEEMLSFGQHRTINIDVA